MPAEEEEGKGESSGEEDSGMLEMVEETLGTLDLREYEVLLNKKKRRKRKEKREGKDLYRRQVKIEKIIKVHLAFLCLQTQATEK